jgi:hypothetical protein
VIEAIADARKITSQAVFRPAKYPYTKRTMIAPTTAPIKPAPWPGLYQPSICPRKLATKAPTMPRMAVRMNPCGSLESRHDELGDNARDKPNDDRPDDAHLAFLHGLRVYVL